jgi:hypothetical protein
MGDFCGAEPTVDLLLRRLDFIRLFGGVLATPVVRFDFDKVGCGHVPKGTSEVGKRELGQPFCVNKGILEGILGRVLSNVDSWHVGRELAIDVDVVGCCLILLVGLVWFGRFRVWQLLYCDCGLFE